MRKLCLPQAVTHRYCSRCGREMERHHKRRGYDTQTGLAEYDQLWQCEVLVIPPSCRPPQHSDFDHDRTGYVEAGSCPCEACEGG